MNHRATKIGRALVVFGEDLPPKYAVRQKFDTIVADAVLQKEIEALECRFVDRSTLTDPGSVYKAAHFLEELSRLKLPDGARVSKSVMYEGYELWWTHYDSLFNYYCLPYTQYKRMLEYLRGFCSIYLYKPPHKGLFFWYLKAYGCDITILREPGLTSPSFLPFGVFIQIMLTLVSLPILILRRPRTMLFIGDKFGKGQDYDFRMKFIYEELQGRGMPFFECIRSLEPWQRVIRNVLIRRRAVVYSEAISFFGRFISSLSFGHSRARRTFSDSNLVRVADPGVRFKSFVATQFFSRVYDDIWAIRIMKWILRAIGVRAAFIPAATERNFHAVLGCKLNGIPSVGILHGVASWYSTPYDFMKGFDGEKRLSVDSYGLWSEWWKDLYIKESRTYAPEQLFVSGPMRPIEREYSETAQEQPKGASRVLFISEQVAEPSEVVPYLRKLMEQKDITLTLKFRPYRDGFEEWIKGYEPDLLQDTSLQIVRGTMQEAIKYSDVVVGSYSTAVLEAFMQLKVPIFLYTRKWGDYYAMGGSDETRAFFAENPDELVARIKSAYMVPSRLLTEMCERYFGNPQKNGSAWVIDKLEEFLKKSTR